MKIIADDFKLPMITSIKKKLQKYKYEVLLEFPFFVTYQSPSLHITFNFIKEPKMWKKDTQRKIKKFPNIVKNKKIVYKKKSRNNN